MDTTPMLMIIIIMLLLYIILFVNGDRPRKKKNADTPQDSFANSAKNNIIGKTKTVFPPKEMQRKPKESDENRIIKPSIFVPETSLDSMDGNQEQTDTNEFEPMLSENQIDAQEVEQEELSLLLDEEIEVSDENLTVREIRLIQQAVVRNKVTEQDKPQLRKTVEKLQGSDFLEKLKSHEELQAKLNAELMLLIAGKEPIVTVEKRDTITDDWTLFL